MTQPNLKRAARLDTKAVALASLPFMGMISFWQVYDGIVPKMLTGTFGLSNSLTGAIMAIDNVFGLFLLPLFGIFSDRCASKLGRRTPFILGGSAVAMLSVPLIAIANNMGSLPLLIGAIILTLLAICAYRTMTVAIVADITPRPLRTKADSIEKIVGYAGTGLMLVAISVMVPKADKPDYLPLFILQAAFILVSAVVYGIFVREPALVEKMREKSLSMGIDEDQIDKDDSPEAGGKERVADTDVRRSIIMLLAATFFYYMSYNAMTTNISRYADLFYGMEGGSYAIINIVTIAGALLSYAPLANLSLKIGRKKVAWHRRHHGFVPRASLAGTRFLARVVRGLFVDGLRAGRRGPVRVHDDSGVLQLPKRGPLLRLLLHREHGGSGGDADSLRHRYGRGTVDALRLHHGNGHDYGREHCRRQARRCYLDRRGRSPRGSKVGDRINYRAKRGRMGKVPIRPLFGSSSRSLSKPTLP